jgi:hypothetical protein
VRSGQPTLMTLERYWPEPKKMIPPINYFSVGEEHWMQDVEFRSRVLGEWEEIPRYEKMGFLREIASLPHR